MKRKPCYFVVHGGYACRLDWPGRKATPGTPEWEARIRRDMCEPCGEEVRQRHERDKSK